MISFVVPAHNEEQLLDRTLDALQQAADTVGDPYEIIVVDDSSSNRTAEIARARGAVVVPVRFRQIARTRNAGATAARGDLLVFVDADTLVPADTLRVTLTAIREGAVGGGAAFRFDGRLALWAVFMRPAVVLTMRLFRLAPGCYLFCTRAAFEAAGRFDERLFALEEIVLSRALRRHGRVVILRESVVSSGRKLRLRSGRKVLGLAAAFLRHGPAMFRSREHLSLWYGQRRQDL